MKGAIELYINSNMISDGAVVAFPKTEALPTYTDLLVHNKSSTVINMASSQMYLISENDLFLDLLNKNPIKENMDIAGCHSYFIPNEKRILNIFMPGVMLPFQWYRLTLSASYNTNASNFAQTAVTAGPVKKQWGRKGCYIGLRWVLRKVLEGIMEEEEFTAEIYDVRSNKK